MIWSFRLTILPLMTLLASSPLAYGDDVMTKITRATCSKMRSAETRIAELNNTLETLPSLGGGPTEQRYGFRSETFKENNRRQTFRIDLNENYPIDRVIIIPAYIPEMGQKGEGYGFPHKFKIEVSHDPEMKNSTVVGEYSKKKGSLPGRYPMNFKFAPITGRYIQITVTRLSPVDEGFLWALQEFIVLSGNYSVATRQEVKCHNAIDIFPNWSPFRLNDGLYSTGLPTNNDESPSNGFLSVNVDSNKVPRWVCLDLGKEYPVDEIRLVPIEPNKSELIGKHPFPRTWKLQLATDPEFENIVWETEEGRVLHPGFPGSSSPIAHPWGKKGRYLRVVCLEMWEISNKDSFHFGLSEIQVYSGGQNIALQKRAYGEHAVEDKENGWHPEFLVDGFTNHRKLIEIPDFFDLLESRRITEEEIARLTEVKNQAIQNTRQVVFQGGGGTAAFGFVIAVWAWLRQRKNHKAAVKDLRSQIARDLHDDIGSNLGGIILLSEVAKGQSSNSKIDEELESIRRTAEVTSQSMQDIVWLIEKKHTKLSDLLRKLKQSSKVSLSEVKTFFAMQPDRYSDRELSLVLRRNVFFAFKEALNNAHRHAHASRIEVAVTVKPLGLIMEVSDNGIGMDVQEWAQTGNGLSNLEARAIELGGRCTIESTPGNGTKVTFMCPFRTKKTKS